MIVSLMLFPDYGVHSSFIQSIARFECARKKRSFDTGAKKPFLPLPCHGLIHRLPAVLMTEMDAVSPASSRG